MKRLLVLLPLLILLAGCSEEKPQQTQPQTQPLTQEATQSQTEKPTAGKKALASVELGDENLGFLSMGADLLLFGEGSLSIVDAKTLEIVITEKVSGVPLPESGLVWTHADGVAYFDDAGKAIVFLGTNLKETMRLQMPEDMVGTACLAADWNTVYYCTASEIRALDMKMGVSRLVMAQPSIKQSVTGVLLDGAVLNCIELGSDGKMKTVLISAKTGEILYDGTFLTNMVGSGTRYYLTMDHKSVEEIIFGEIEGDPRNFWPKQTPERYQILPERNAVVTACADETGIILDYYDLTDGKRTASICIEKQNRVTAFAAETDGGIWVLCGKTMYLWNPDRSELKDTQVYTMPRITREAQDAEGLAKVKENAQELGQKFDVDWLLADDAWQVIPWDYTFETEYIPRAFEDALAELHNAMTNFPENFFTLAAKKSENKKLTIVLVREINGAPEKGTLATNGCIQYRLDGNLYVALRMDSDLERNFYHAIGHLIDSRVLSAGTAFYEWEKLNPPSFVYDNDYIANLDRNAADYLRESDRWFIDTFSMSFPVEDRSRIFEYACLPGNEMYFTSTIMKQKLQRVCKGIREAFELENVEEKFLWEQYLG